MNSDTFRIDVRQIHEHPHADHLIGHLGLSALAMDGLLECRSSVGCSSVVLYIYEIATLSHVHLPSAEKTEIAVLHHL